MANPRTMITFLGDYASRINTSNLKLADARRSALNSIIENSINERREIKEEEKKQYIEDFTAFIRIVDRHFSDKEMYAHLSTLAASFRTSDVHAKNLYEALNTPTPDNLQQLIESAKVQDKILMTILECSKEKIFDEVVSTCTSAALFIVQILLAPIALVLTLAIGSALSCAFEKFKFYDAALLYFGWMNDTFSNTKKHANEAEKNYKWVTFDEISQSAIALEGFFGKSTAHRTAGGNITDDDKKKAEPSEGFMAPEAFTVR